MEKYSTSSVPPSRPTWESLETQMELEAQAIAASGHTEDFRNGVVAFARKQPVTFTGR